MNAWAIVGIVCPTFSVPGIRRSGTILRRRNIAVVVANEPMPSVSKKLVTAPTASWPASGKRPSVAGESPVVELARASRIAFVQPVR